MGKRNLYDIGDKVRLLATWTVSGSYTNPTTPQCRVKSPPGTTTVYATSAASGVSTGVVQSATGQYYVDVLPTSEGVWHYRWTGTGNAYAAEEGSFEIRASGVI